MNHLKTIMSDLHRQSKAMLQQLYADKQIYYSSVRSSDQPIEDEKIFRYQELSLRFRGTGFRTAERLTLLISIPFELIMADRHLSDGNTFGDSLKHTLLYEDYLLRILTPKINALSESYENDKKDSREKARFGAQLPSEVILHRSGCVWDSENREFKLRLQFHMPLINGTIINGKSGYRAVWEIMELIYNLLVNIDSRDLVLHLKTYEKQLQIKQFLRENHLVTFIADGSILPREGDTVYPLKSAVPFKSPASLLRIINFEDGTSMSGMAIPCGITVITGGGYSGKSTLLDAIEMGIYQHLPCDGREYAITDETAVKIYAEDGRMIHPLDISPFFSFMPANQNIHSFHTICASGSVSQAANIIEAFYAGSKLLLIDEDRSAANFMIRDSLMRKIIQKEPIIPFTDRVRLLSEVHGISTILVIGGSGEYLKYADTILLMNDYVVTDITEEVSTIPEMNRVKDRCGNLLSENESLKWLKHRYLIPQKHIGEFTISKAIQIARTHFIKIDDFVSDVTLLTALISKQQMNTLAWILERFLTEENSGSQDLLIRAARLSKLISNPNIIETVLSHAYDIDPFFEEVRPFEIVAALNRMRGIQLLQESTTK